MKFKKNKVTIGGRTFFYWEKNSQGAKTMVLLHGFPGNHEGLLGLARGLAQYHIIIPDLPGCGASSLLSGKHTLKNYSDWLAGFLESLSIGQAIIIGHSFGSRLALMFASEHSEKVSQLILIAPVIKVEGLLARVVSVYYKITSVLPQYLQKIMLSNGFGKKMGDKVIFRPGSARLHAKIIQRDIKEIKKIPTRVSIDLFDEFHTANLAELGSKIKKESLIIAGDLDQVSPLSAVRELADNFHTGTLKIMKNCGHLVPLEKPLTTARFIKNWLEGFPNQIP